MNSQSNDKKNRIPAPPRETAVSYDKDPDLNTLLAQLENLTVVDDDIKELFPEADPEIDVKRLGISNETDIKKLVSTIQNALKAVRGDLFRSGRNMALALRFLCMTKDQKSLLDKAEQIDKAKPSFLTLNTFKSFWEYYGTKRFVVNIKRCVEIMGRSKKVNNKSSSSSSASTLTTTTTGIKEH